MKKWRKVMLGKVTREFEKIRGLPLDVQQAFLHEYSKKLTVLFESLYLITEKDDDYDDSGYWVVRRCDIFNG